MCRCVCVDGRGSAVRRCSRVGTRAGASRAEFLANAPRQPQLRRRPGLGVRQQPLQLPQPGNGHLYSPVSTRTGSSEKKTNLNLLN